MDETTTVMRFAEGDEKAFAELVNQYKERIYLVILRIVRNKDEALDLAQEAFAKAYQSRRSFRHQASFYTWIYRIAVNLALNFVNRSHHRLHDSIDDLPASLFSTLPEQTGEKQELKKAIDSAIMALPARQRTVFVLRHYEQKNNAEIASLLSITEGAVKANYHQAIQKLKRSLGAYLREGTLSA